MALLIIPVLKNGDRELKVRTATCRPGNDRNRSTRNQSAACNKSSYQIRVRGILVNYPPTRIYVTTTLTKVLKEQLFSLRHLARAGKWFTGFAVILFQYL